MMLKIPAKFRLGLMGVLVLALSIAGLLGPGWATPAQAQGTVPQDPLGPCELAAPAVLAGANVTNPLDLGIGSVQLLSNLAGIGMGTVRPLVMPIVEFTANLIPPDDLENSPPGWTLLSLCGIAASAEVAGGEAVTYVVKGQKICFDLPVGGTAAYNTGRVAYFDLTLDRWVTFIKTVVGATEACHTSFRLLPSTYALFGANLPR